MLASTSTLWLRATTFGHSPLSTTSGYLYSEEDALHEATQGRHRIGWTHKD